MIKKLIICVLFIVYLSQLQCVEAKNVTLYVVPAITDSKLLPYSSIPSSCMSDTISIKASNEEFRPASFVIISDETLDNVTLIPTDLLSGNNSIPRCNVDIKVVKSWYQGEYQPNSNSYFITGYYLTPELLLKDDSLIKVDGENWTSYRIPNPDGRNYLKVNGSYIDISNDSIKYSGSAIIPISKCPIKDTATLQPITLKQNENKQFWITIHIPTGTLPGDYIGKINLACGDTLLSTINLNVTVLPIKLLEPDKEYSVYYRGTLASNGSISSEDKTIAQFTAEMQDLYNHGVKNPNVYTSNGSQLTQMYQIRQQIGMNNSNLYCLGLTLDNNVRVVQVKNTTQQYGVNDVFVCGPDETSINDSTSRNKIAAIHTAGGKVFAAQSYTQAQTVADVLDLAAVSGTPNKDLASLYHSYNHKIFSYANPQSIPEYPKTVRVNYGLLLWQRDYDGAMNYAYQDAFGDIWNDWDSASGYRDHCYTYPTANGVIDTIQWEGFREGVNDLRYLATLQRAIMVNPSDTTAIEAQNYLNNLKNTDLSNLDLDTVRSRIIDYILLLESSSHKVSVNCGSGSGYYPTNSQSTIAAYTPQSGMIFDKWIGDTSYVFNVSASTTNVTVPSHSISLAATYKPISNAWYDSNYSYRKLLTVNRTQVSNTSLSSFSILLSLTDPDLKSISNGGKIQYSNGRDIGFVLPDGTDMNYEIESYNSTTGKLIAWVRVPFLSAMTDTVFYMYFGNSNAYNNTYQNINSVWDSNYKGVYHLGETETGNIGDFKDSTSNSNNNKNVINQPNSTTGQIGNAQRFNGVNSCINIGSKTSLNLVNAFTISAWVNPTIFANNAYTGIVWKANNNDTSQNTAYGLTTFYYANQKVPELFATTSAGKGKYACGTTELQVNQNQYIVATYNATSNTTIIYFNGISDKKSSAITGTVNITNSDVYIGVRNNWFWNGTIDEVRISDIDRTPDWIRTEYNNQINPSLFISEGSTEIRPPINTILPIANFSTNTTQGVSPLSVQFTDLSQNTLSRSWDFDNDGIQDSNKACCVYVYTDPGNYTVNLTAINANGTDSKLTTITIQQESVDDVLPVANFSGNVTCGNAPLTVKFMDLSKNATAWDWNFGDGNNSTVQNPINIYSKAGNYTVNLTVSNANGTNSTLGKIDVSEIRPAPEVPVLPVANFTSNVTSGNVPLTVKFTDLSKNVNAWKWDFGDGNTSTNQNPEHTYIAVGKYTVNLTVYNANGTASKLGIITVGSRNAVVVSFNPLYTDLYPGSSKNIQIVMDRVPSGLSGFNFTISISNPDVVGITAVSFPSWLQLPINSTLPSSSVLMKGADLTNQVVQDNTNVFLGNITLTGKKVGNTNLSIVPTAIDDDNGDPISPDVVSGIVEVISILPAFPGYTNPPTDLNNDGLYEDINGNGNLESDDVAAYYVNMDWIGQNGLTAYFDYNHNNRIDFNDVVKLRKMVNTS